MNKFEKFLLAGFLLVALLFAESLLSVQPYQGNIPDPVQINLVEPETITVKGKNGEVELSLLAEYSVAGVIKSKKKYSSDYPSQVSVYDFALAWGDLNMKEIDKHIKYSQSGRWYRYLFPYDSPVSGQYIANHSANVHLIHKNEEILKKLKRSRKNHYVRLEGYLVSVNFQNGPWRSSLSRTDTGNGACEIMYVTNVKIIN
ncbi:MAG: hypothetical protein GXY16_09520 [Syntrophomonadaceae bacterium]|nr:hypothetical protein [Syntrophomonadaceae bacterium]